MKASQPAYRGGALCRDLTASLIPIQTLISVHMSRQASPFYESSMVYWRDLGRRDKISPYETKSWLPRRKCRLAHALLS